MKIIVAIKQVPVRDSTLRVRSDERWIEEENLEYEINEPDAYALEEALQLKDQHGAEVVVLCAGPERSGTVIREALAKGADRAIHLVADDLGSLDSLGVAARLAEAIRPERPDLILTGLQSEDLGLGQTGVVLAEVLDLPHSTIIMQVEVAGTEIEVKRELEEGWFQKVKMPMPALLTIQSGIGRLRYATLMGIKKAKTKEVKIIAASSLSPTQPCVASLERIYLPEKKKQIQLLNGSPAEVAAQLVEKLKYEVRVL